MRTPAHGTRCRTTLSMSLSELIDFVHTGQQPMRQQEMRDSDSSMSRREITSLVVKYFEHERHDTGQGLSES